MICWNRYIAGNHMAKVFPFEKSEKPQIAIDITMLHNNNPQSSYLN